MAVFWSQGDGLVNIIGGTISQLQCDIGGLSQPMHLSGLSDGICQRLVLAYCDMGCLLAVDRCCTVQRQPDTHICFASVVPCILWNQTDLGSLCGWLCDFSVKGFVVPCFALAQQSLSFQGCHFMTVDGHLDGSQ